MYVYELLNILALPPFEEEISADAPDHMPQSAAVLFPLTFCIFIFMFPALLSFLALRLHPSHALAGQDFLLKVIIMLLSFLMQELPSVSVFRG